MDKVTVIIPVYNMASLVGKCIDSLINQTYKNIEIILVDDGSNDSSGIICDDFSKVDSRIKVLHKINGGIGSALNSGLEIMSGDYLLFVDSDDYVSPYFVERLVDLAKEYDAAIAQCDRYCFDHKEGIGVIAQKKGDIVIYNNNDEIMDDFFHYKRISRNLAARIFKSELFINLRFEETRQVVDVITLPLLLQKTNKYVFCSEKYYYVYETPNSISRGEYTNKKHDDFLYSLDFFEKFIEEYYPNHIDYLYYRKTIVIRDCYCDIVKNRAFINREDCLKECVRIFKENYNFFHTTQYYKNLSKYSKIGLLLFYISPMVYSFFKNRK